MNTTESTMIMTCSSDKIQVLIHESVHAEITSWDDFLRFLRIKAVTHPFAPLYSSSTMDFPHEETVDPDLIALCQRIQASS